MEENKQNDYTYFSNKECKYYPCHKVTDTEIFNCMFCFCPLYALADKCGGNYTYTAEGIKDCSMCTLPHLLGGREHILNHMGQVMDLAKKGGNH